MAGPDDPVGTWPQPAWDLYLTGYESGIDSATNRAWAEARHELVGDIKAAGAELRESSAWPPCPSWSDLIARTEARFAAAAERTAAFDAMTSDQRIADAAASWGLEDVAEDTGPELDREAS